MKGQFQSFQIQNDNKIYDCISFLGKGKFGNVYECVQRNLNQRLAIKIIHYERNIRIEQIQKLKKEIDILLLIQDTEHAIQIFDHFQQKNTYFIVTELMEGGNLKQYLDDRGNLSEGLSAEFLRQIIKGLVDIHERGIIHRDLKPENILLSRDGPDAILKICDFGLSNWQNIAKSDVGSPVYQAPELKSGKQQTYAVDI